MKKKPSVNQYSALLRALSRAEPASVTTLKSLIANRKVPTRLKWQPDLCVKRGRNHILVHPLVSPEIPAYLKSAIDQLRSARFKNTYVLLLARDIATEASDGASPMSILASVVAVSVADKALQLGCTLAFESQENVHMVFDRGYKPLPRCVSREETGHIPKWLYSAVAKAPAFSTHLSLAVKAFAKQYARATTRATISNEREADLLLKFAKRFARGEPTLFFPIEELRVLRQFEMAKVNKGRDHFFHTFNNLFLGFYILGTLYRKSKQIADVDNFIQNRGVSSKLNSWESLWFLTCMFHDPAYIAEKFWGMLRFSYGVAQDESVDDKELPDSVRQQIVDMWDTKFLGARRDLSDLYNRAAKKWVPPSVRKIVPMISTMQYRKHISTGGRRVTV